MDKINQYITIDFETGGFEAYKNQATQVAAQAFRGDTFEEIGRYTAYIKPYAQELGLKYTDAALQFTGTTMADLEAGETVHKVVNELCKLFKMANTGRHVAYYPVLVGHNIDFDIPFLQFMFDYTGQDLSKYLMGKKDHKGIFRPSGIDTMWLARMHDPLKQKMENHKLETVAACCGVELIDAHEAMADVKATTEVANYFAKSLRGEQVAMIQNVEEQEERFRKTFEFGN